MPPPKRSKKRKPARPSRAAISRRVKAYPTNIVRKLGLGKSQTPYAEKLKVLRSILSGFDAKALDALPLAKPRTEKARAQKRRTLQKIASTYQRVKPFVTRSFKAVAPKNKQDLSELKKYVGISNFKGLRAIPVPTNAPGKTLVSFDKDHRVKIKIGAGYAEKFFRFPHMPVSLDDAVAMLEEMLPSMPQGTYVIASRHHFLIPTSAPRDLLVEEFKKFYIYYEAKTDFIRLIFGFKWMGRGDIARKRLEEIRTERGKARQQRRDARISLQMKALKAMDAHFKGSRAAQLVGAPSPADRGEPWRQKMSIEDAKRIIANGKRRKTKLSARARKTGRR